ncbi:MAG: hypothetical protein HQ562_03345 [Candidatus Marinimicrobia bacterium]|nr:hypothetical protein [Candidatus Neomarinimicrobiota bacterium]
MKRYLTGLITIVVLLTVLLAIMAAQPVQEDSIKYYVDRLESILKAEIAENRENGRYQLQSFTVDRTHWHYILDTVTGELYRLELSRTPGNSKWVLMAEANFDRSSLIDNREEE